MRLDGWLNIDKPSGITSYGVIARLKGLTGQRHIGHAGTLDPLATGVLPIAFGRAARTIEFLHQVSKTYRAIIELGVETDTLDTEGKVIFRAEATHIDREAVQKSLEPFIGIIQQVPPMYSALKKNGTPLYELARRGETVEVKPRAVTIHQLDLIDFTSPFVTIDVECGSGTYIRSIARDLGQTLGVGGHLKSLRRTKYGEFDIQNAVELEALNKVDDLLGRLLPLDFALTHCPVVTLSSEDAEKITHGVLSIEFLSQLNEKASYKVYAPGGDLLAMIDASGTDPRLKVFLPYSVDS